MMIFTPVLTASAWFACSKIFAARHSLAHKHIELILFTLANRKMPLPPAEMIEKATHQTASNIVVMVVVAAIFCSISCLAGFLQAYEDKNEKQEIVKLDSDLNEVLTARSSNWIELSTFEDYFTELEKKLPQGSDDRLKARAFKIYYRVAKENRNYTLRPESSMIFTSNDPPYREILRDEAKFIKKLNLIYRK